METESHASEATPAPESISTTSSDLDIIGNAFQDRDAFVVESDTPDSKPSDTIDAEKSAEATGDGNKEAEDAGEEESDVVKAFLEKDNPKKEEKEESPATSKEEIVDFIRKQNPTLSDGAVESIYNQMTGAAPEEKKEEKSAEIAEGPVFDLGLSNEELDEALVDPGSFGKALQKALSRRDQAYRQAIESMQEKNQADMGEMYRATICIAERMVLINDAMRENPAIREHIDIFNSLLSKAFHEGKAADEAVQYASDEFKKGHDAYQRIMKTKERIDIRGKQDAGPRQGTAPTRAKTSAAASDPSGLGFLGAMLSKGID